MVRYIRTGQVWTREQALDVAADNRRHWDEHGFGWRPAVERATGEVIGFVGLNLTEEGATRGLPAGEHEIGWWLHPSAWGRGYASEAVAAVRDEAFGRLGAPSLVARVHPDNAASLRVAERLGLRRALVTTTSSGVDVVVLRRSA